MKDDMIRLIHLWVRVYFGAKEYGIGDWPDYPQNSCTFYGKTNSCDYCEIVDTVGYGCENIKSLKRWKKHQTEKHGRAYNISRAIGYSNGEWKNPNYKQIEPGCKRCKELVRDVISEYLKYFDKHLEATNDPNKKGNVSSHQGHSREIRKP